MLRYCSPISVFTPTAVAATLNVARPVVVRKLRMPSSSAGITPSANSRPPKLSPRITMVCVKNMLSTPPRDSSLAMSPQASGNEGPLKNHCPSSARLGVLWK